MYIKQVYIYIYKKLSFEIELNKQRNIETVISKFSNHLNTFITMLLESQNNNKTVREHIIIRFLRQWPI